MRLDTGLLIGSHPENPFTRSRAKCPIRWSLLANTRHFFNHQEFLFSSPALRSRTLDFFYFPEIFWRLEQSFAVPTPSCWLSDKQSYVFQSFDFPNNLFLTLLHSPWQKFPIITTYLDKATGNMCGLFLHKELSSGRFPLLTLFLPIHPGRLAIQMMKSLPGVVRCSWGHEYEPGYIPFNVHFPWLCELL